VATGGARRGRRDNGLVAAEYAAAGDVDPRIGEHLLDVLGLRGIAAYLQPAADLHPITRSTTLPARPTDRLFVDRTHLGTARSYLRQLTNEAGDEGEVEPTGTQRSENQPRPERAGSQQDRPTGSEAPAAGAPDPDGTAEPSPSADNIDDLFAAIVAGFDRDAEVAGWPEAENLPTGRATRTGPDGTGTDVDGTDAQPDEGAHGLRRWQDSTIQPDTWRAPADDRGLLDGLDGFDPSAYDEDDDEGYTPPPPPPLPRIAPATIVAVIAIIVGVVIFFNPGLLPVDETVAMVFGFCGILGGFVALIWRLRPGDDDDDHWDPNDGAVV
jgi:hypothetical protein